MYVFRVKEAALTIFFIGFPLWSSAKPVAPQIFCETYPDSQTCSQGIDCRQCHTAPPELNLYGSSVQSSIHTLSSGGTFSELLPLALQAVEVEDSDNDGESNLTEISQGTLAYDAASNNHPVVESREWNSAYALRKVSTLFCGHSPSFDDLEDLRKNNSTEAEKQTAVHDTLSKCLNSDYWKHEALHRIADKRIRPLFQLGLNGAIGIGDYQWDYRLFSYVLTGDRDARDLLLAKYHIAPDGSVIEGTIPRERPFVNEQTGQLNLGSGQPLIPERRAGLITSQWFMSFFTMFAELPRNTASQAYRAYLGLDIAKSEGLIPIEGEPRDVDNKGVDAPQCAVCHSTLDPLAYAFSAYAGVESTPDNPIGEGNPFGTYYPEGTDWEADGHLFGEPVLDLLDWALKAANSDAFKKNLASIFFNYATGKKPGPADEAEFKALWQSTTEDKYSANKLIHRLVDTLAFGGVQK